MKKALLLFSIILIAESAFTQAPGVKWTNIINASANGSIFFDAKPTPDKGYIVASTDGIFAGDLGLYRATVVNKSGGGRGWVIKLDSARNITWQSSHNTGGNAALLSIVPSSDGGYVAAGHIVNPNPPFDTSQLYVVKYNSEGDLVWQKTYGAGEMDVAHSIAKTSSGGYVVAGYTKSTGGDVGGTNHGRSDAWVIKLNANGDSLWKRVYGGSEYDSAYAVVQTADEGFIVVGGSNSSNGQLTGNNGSSDGWIFKINAAGVLQWQRNLGGTAADAFRGVIANADGGATAVGFTRSATAASNGIKGKTDLWVVRVSGTGDLVWSKGFGGTEDEFGLSVIRTQGDDFLVAGGTGSTNMDVTGNNGLFDAWLLKVSGDGNLIWQKCAGTNSEQIATTVMYHTETDFSLAGGAPALSAPTSRGYLARLGNANTIKGLLYFDLNSNGIKDASENGFDDAIVKTTAPGFERSSIPVNGLFQVDVDLGAYTTTPTINHPYFVAVPASANSNFSNYFNTDSFSFAVQPIPGMHDLVITAVPLTVARPGFEVGYKLFYKNLGSTIVPTGTILFKRDSRMALISVSPAVSSVSGDTLKWDFTNLEPLVSGTINITMRVEPPPTVVNGTVLSSIAIITPVIGDVTPSNDTAIIRQVVQGSYDPNDKADNLGGRITTEEVSTADYINYVIRFQNTGTDTAFNITIRDTLDAKLNWNTLEMVGASHPYQLQISNQNRLVWQFDNILLPDSNINEPASHGFIAYRIKPQTNLVIGNIIENTASIYFDYNLPEITNEVQTLVEAPVILPLTLLDFTAVYRGPAAQLRWSTSDEENFSHFEVERGSAPGVYTVIRTVPAGQAGGIKQYQLMDDLATVAGNKFFYRLKMVDHDRKFTYSSVQMIRKDGKSVNEITVNPNPLKNGSGSIFINLEAGALAGLSILDMQGRVVQTSQVRLAKGFTSLPLATPFLKAGMYLLRVTTADITMTTRFVISKN